MIRTLPAPGGCSVLMPSITCTALVSLLLRVLPKVSLHGLDRTLHGNTPLYTLALFNDPQLQVEHPDLLVEVEGGSYGSLTESWRHPDFVEDDKVRCQTSLRVVQE